LAHSSPEYMRKYMRGYRDVAKILRGLNSHLRSANIVWMREQIIEMIRAKYNATNDELHRLIGDLYEFFEAEFPGHSMAEINEILNVHLLYYFREGILGELLMEKRHPSLVSYQMVLKPVKEKLEWLEKEKEKVKQK
jgi:hypothetical protein